MDIDIKYLLIFNCWDKNRYSIAKGSFDFTSFPEDTEIEEISKLILFWYPIAVNINLKIVSK